MATSSAALGRSSKVSSVLLWCLPALLGFILFLFSFPIDRQIPFWPHWNLALLFLAWFLFVAPIATVIAIIVLLKTRKSGFRHPLITVLVWTAVILSVLASAFILVGMWASTY